jgi:hypothetical protein
MVRVFALVLCLAVCLPAADSKKHKKEKVPDIEILEASGRRGANTVRMDGHLRNASERSIHDLALQFDFFDSDGTLLTTQKATIDEPSLEPGQEAAFHMELNNPARAVKFQISATGAGDRDLRVGKPGPFAIE